MTVPLASSVVPWTPGAEAGTALVCISWAGAGAAPFRSWGAAAAGRATVYGIRLPGRESRMAEPVLRDLEDIVECLLADVSGLSHERLVVFGLCSGALLAFELARALEVADRPPAGLVVASQLPPRDLAARAPEGTEPDAVLIERYLKEEQQASPELVELLLPVVAGDMECVSRYRYRPDPRLEAPIIAFRGAADDVVPPESVAGWAKETRGAFVSHEVGGADHLFRGAAWPVLGEAVLAALTPA